MAAERNIDTETGPGSPFPTTLWTVVLNAGGGSQSLRRDALDELIRTYWRPVYLYVRRRNGDREAAKDLTQGFFAVLLEREAFQGLTPEGGKFRSYLLTALRHYLADAADHVRAVKRGGNHVIQGLDFDALDQTAESPAGSGESPDEAFRKEWALSVIGGALARLRREYEDEGRAREFEAFCRHLSYSGDLPSYADLAKSLGVKESDVRNRLHAARARYADAILRVLRASTQTDAEADEELRDLFAAFR